jgi:hypothetical protein
MQPNLGHRRSLVQFSVRVSGGFQPRIAPAMLPGVFVAPPETSPERKRERFCLGGVVLAIQGWVACVATEFNARATCAPQQCKYNLASTQALLIELTRTELKNDVSCESVQI